MKTCYLQGCGTVLKKPETSLFLQPLYRELKILEKGIEVQIYTNSGFINRICRCLLLAGTFDERLEEIKPTIEISRPPRSYSKYGTNWKVSEFRNFLLYFGILVLADILPSIQLANFSLLSHSIFTLLKRKISKDDIKRPEEALKNFCQQFEKIYGERYMLMSIHQLLHLYDNVVQLGPG